ncbi:MAG: heavy metal translocating P-type ATPase [Acidobacteriota bacterium]
MNEPIPCDHCGLPVPAGLVDAEAELQFCCSGCRLAYEIIHDHGLGGFYGLRERLDQEAQPAKSSGRAFADFDDPAFFARYVTGLPDGLATVELYLEGVHCAACVWLVERIPTAMAGVVEIRLDFGRALAVVTWDPAATPLSEIARFLDQIGYQPHPFRGASTRDLARQENRSLLIRIAIAGALAGNVMLLAFALYGGHFHGISPEHRAVFRWLSLVLTLPSVGWCARPFFRGAVGALQTRTLHMDLPIAVGILAGFIQGSVNIVFDRGEIYFESVTALIFLLLVGRYIQQSQQRAAAGASELLFSLSPSTARLVEEDGVREVPIEALGSGSIVEVLAGDTVPGDGIVVQGRSNLDRSLLTGESRPEGIGEGENVHAGTVNLSSPLRIRIEKAGEETRVGRLMRLVEDGARRKAPIVQLADRISGWFVATVLGLAVVTVLIWLPLDPDHAVEHAVALLIVSCPCALGLATPLAVGAALAAAARSGILIKNGAALEVLARSGRMYLDKTGTVTEGRMRVVHWWGSERAKGMVAVLEAESTHPVAVALVEAFGNEEPSRASEIHQTTGAGIVGVVEGLRIAVGSNTFAEAQIGGSLGSDTTAQVEAATAEGLTPVIVIVDGEVKAVAALGDPLRDEAAATLAEVERQNWHLTLLSGDHPAVVSAVAGQIGLAEADALGGVTPEGKVDVIRETAEQGPVAMVGDGVNDAAALAAATVGIGVHGGAEAALAAADIYLAKPGVEPILDLLEGARRTLRVIRRNLALSLTYNITAAALAMTGHMSPILAAVLMPLSSITVVVSSYRAKTF